MSPLQNEVVRDVLKVSLSPVSLSRPRNVDNASVDRWPIVFVKLNKYSTAFTCRVSNAI